MNAITAAAETGKEIMKRLGSRMAEAARKMHETVQAVGRGLDAFRNWAGDIALRAVRWQVQDAVNRFEAIKGIGRAGIGAIALTVALSSKDPRSKEYASRIMNGMDWVCGNGWETEILR